MATFWRRFRTGTPPTPAGTTNSTAGTPRPTGTRPQTPSTVSEHGGAEARGNFVARAGQPAAGGLDLISIRAALPNAEPIKRAVQVIYDAGRHALSNLTLHGSWDLARGAHDPSWPSPGVPMRPLGDGRWAAEVELLDDGSGQVFEWGVKADGPSGRARWAMMGEGNQRFALGADTKQVEYAPTTYHRLGARRGPDGEANFRFWAPNAQAVTVEITRDEGEAARFDMALGKDGLWSASVPDGWARFQGQPYRYAVTTSTGDVVLRRDPYARQMQGEQRGLSRTYVDAQTGAEVNQYYLSSGQVDALIARYGSVGAAPAEALAEAREASRRPFMRFEARRDPNDTRAVLILKDALGRPLDRKALLERLPFDPRMDPALADDLRGGRFDDLWSRGVAEDGTIAMIDEGGSWTTLVNSIDDLVGLGYEIRIYERGENGEIQVEGDRNADGAMSPDEIEDTYHNDRWSAQIGPLSGIDYRTSLVAETKHVWKNDAVPREKDPTKWVVYQLHVGSFFGDGLNGRKSDLADVVKRLEYLKDIGIDAIELLPVNEFEGVRDWGYLGVTSLGLESAYGFVDEDGREVTGAEAFMRLVDKAHGLGINVIADVVYNHAHGEHNDLWNLDGPDNPYFKWDDGNLRETQWGAIPAYDDPRVRQFAVDHAVDQVETFHVDGLRFDFTEPLKAPWGGGQAGWELMREINRQVHFYNPDVFTIAEQFDYDPGITQPVLQDNTGGGFDAQWYTEIQHRVSRDSSADRPGWIQAAARGWRTRATDELMHVLVNAPGLNGWATGVSMISNHDEVGNAERLVVTAAGGEAPTMPNERARGLARLAAGLGFVGPGTPFFFQGDEFLATNPFSWGRPSTWDLDWDWQDLPREIDPRDVRLNDEAVADYRDLVNKLPQTRRVDDRWATLTPSERATVDRMSERPPEERDALLRDVARNQTRSFYQDMIALRKSHPALAAGSPVTRVYTHNDNNMLAFTRGFDQQFLVVASANPASFERYGMELPEGQWKEVFNSDAAAYGGDGVGNFGKTISGGFQSLRIPAHGMLVFQRV